MNVKNLILTSAIICFGVLVVDFIDLTSNFSYPLSETISNSLTSLFICSVLVVIFGFLCALLKKRTFTTWWRFAKYGIPVTLILLLAINFGILRSPTQGSFGWGGLINSAVDIWAIIFVLTVFVIGSIVQIARGYFVRE